jgi:hypothetical protein
VAGAIVGRGAERAAVQVLLDDVADGPATLALWGEAGIGKTTIWTAGVAAADLRGHTVFQCRPAIAEIRLTYAGLTDLLVHVDEVVLDDLPGLQRRALDAALLRSAEGDPPPDPRAVAAGLLSVFDRLTALGPLLVAIDDLQWLDEPTRRVLAYATRRAYGPLAVLTAERADRVPEVDSALGPADATRLRTAQVGPMSVGRLHRVLQREAGRSFSRPTAIRIAERSIRSSRCRSPDRCPRARRVLMFYRPGSSSSWRVRSTPWPRRFARRWFWPARRPTRGSS